jgi:uncharacterized protein (TIGR02117 family)
MAHSLRARDATNGPGNTPACLLSNARSVLRLAAIVASLATAVVAGCAVPVKGMCPPSPDDPAETVQLVVHGWHAGIVFSREREAVLAWPVAREFAGAQYLEVGWGDRQFYQAKEPHWGMALEAVLVPTASVLHVMGFSGPAAERFPGSEVVAIRLSLEAFDRLSRHVGRSFATDTHGRASDLGPGLYGRSRFYLSRDTYHAFNTCNVWTARALRAAGCATTPAAALTVGGLLRQVRAFAM